MSKKETAMAKTETPDVMGVVVPDVTGFMTELRPEDLLGIQIEKIVTFKANQVIRGIYLGMGPVVESTDPVTGEVKELGTHRVQVSKDIIIRLISTYQLARELPQHVGKRVRIIKLGQVERGTKRVNDYIVAPELNQDAPATAGEAAPPVG